MPHKNLFARVTESEVNRENEISTQNQEILLSASSRINDTNTLQRASENEEVTKDDRLTCYCHFCTGPDLNVFILAALSEYLGFFVAMGKHRVYGL